MVENKKLIFGILLLVIVAVVFISGCVQEETLYDGEEVPLDGDEETTEITTEPEIPLEGEEEIPLVGKFEWFQTGNTQSITQFQLKQSSELEDNRMGDMLTLHTQIQNESPDYLANRINETGLKWMRLSLDTFDWREVEEIGAYSEHYIYPEQDGTITALADKDINVMYTIVFWDEEIQANQEEGYSRFKTEEEIQRYLDYVKFIVGHFKDRIEYYEILNESNIGGWNPPYADQQYVEVDDYINLVKRTVPVIRQEDPKAKIVAGGIAPLYRTEDTMYLNSAGREYLFGILESDVMPLVDAFSWHATGGTSPEYGAEHYYSYPALLQEIKDVASAHGFEGEYISEEMHWRTSETLHSDEYDGYSKITSAKYLARAIVLHLGMDITSGLAECLECQPKQIVIQSLSTLMAGAETTDLSIEIESEAEKMRSYTFSLSNGDKLIALWTDGVAVDEEAGMDASLTIPNLSAQEVTGIDVLNGYQQPITTSNENGNLIIRNLIVRDYPLILRVS
ncbi:MAG: hypothetical protein ABII90_11300 [Bacteroidota bacterium]